jgi:hypothetical protein
MPYFYIDWVGGSNMRRKKYVIKEAGVFLIGTILICSSLLAIATTNEIPTPKTSMNIRTTVHNKGILPSENVLWDNWVDSWSGSLAAQLEPPGYTRLDAFPADDFMFESDTEVNRVYWGGGYWNCNYKDGPKDYHYDWNITFFNDDGSGYHPGSIYAGPFTISDKDLYKTIEAMNSTTVANGIWGLGYYATLPDPVTFNSNNKYWISIYALGDVFPQSAWAYHNESFGGILLHEANFKSEYFNIPNWTNTSEEFGEKYDMLYALLGPGPDLEVTVTKGFGVSVDITNNGVVNATNTNVSISTTGGLVLIGKSKIIPVGNITIGDTVSVKSMLIGIGKIAIDIMVTCDYLPPGRQNISGLLLLFLIV